MENDKKLQARNLFFQTELTQTQIAEMLDVNRKTIYLWAKEGAWQQAKAAARHMPSILIGQYYAQLGALNETIQNRQERPYPTREEAEIQRKLTLTIAQLQKRLSPVERVEEMTLFVHNVMDRDQDLARKIMEQASTYIHDSLPGDFVTDVLTRQRSNRQADEQFFGKSHSDVSYEKTLANNATSENTSLSFGEGRGEVPCGTNGASAEAGQNTRDSATTAASGDNNTISPMPHSDIQNDEASANNTTPIEDAAPSPKETDGVLLELATDITPWYQYLDNKYNISQDPYIIYRRGVYCIQSQSPLWGHGKSLF